MQRKGEKIDIYSDKRDGEEGNGMNYLFVMLIDDCSVNLFLFGDVVLFA